MQLQMRLMRKWKEGINCNQGCLTGNVKKRNDEILQLLQTQINRVTEYDEYMVKRLIEMITVFDDKLIFECKSGMMFELKR